MEIQSTLREENSKSETCVVYDAGSGRIVLVHEFIGDGTGLYGHEGREERARISLEDARKHPAAPARLQVLHLESGFKLSPGTLYRVDVSAGKLVSHRQLPNAISAGAAKFHPPAK
jgi:hypothetical protein